MIFKHEQNKKKIKEISKIANIFKEKGIKITVL